MTDQEKRLILGIRLWIMRHCLDLMWIEIFILRSNSFFLDRFVSMGTEYLKLEDGQA